MGIQFLSRILVNLQRDSISFKDCPKVKLLRLLMGGIYFDPRQGSSPRKNFLYDSLKTRGKKITKHPLLLPPPSLFNSFFSNIAFKFFLISSSLPPYNFPNITENSLAD